MMAGMRYTKLGMVCITSRIGRVIRRAHSLLASRIPIGTPMTMEMRLAISISASVCIVRSQRPSAPTMKSITATMMTSEIFFAANQASTRKTRKMTHHGRPRSAHSTKRIACRIVCEIALKR
ncbi:hypothetical protein D3C71_621150 [compost metagenome]